MNELEPVIGATVARKDDTKRIKVGVVKKFGDPGSGRVGVFWSGEKGIRFENLADLASGLHPRMEVEHQPRFSVHESFGVGVVRAIRSIGGQDQALVEFPRMDHSAWLPWQRLARHIGIKEHVYRGIIDSGWQAERNRLRMLACAIELWNENTGSLATFDIDPLPHQIQLVHHILASGDYNWLIADDVGLGKTIEVGLLLSALRQRGEADRVLLITPAGITKQWKEELHGRFRLSDYRIYGDEFAVSEPREWGMYAHVIASMDRLKSESHLESILQAEPWDLVIIDEAHRMSRSDQGRWQEETDRYHMARRLRSRTSAMVLLSATPHQGKQDRFAALLELLHPDRREEFRKLDFSPEILGEMVFRNYKSDVTDMEGRPLFHGKEVRRIAVPGTNEAKEFDAALRRYLRKGYDAERRSKGATGRAIGFVMVVYRKLAASSVAAIHRALKRRLDRLNGLEIEDDRLFEPDDSRFQGELEETRVLNESAQSFFEEEREMLSELIELAVRLMRSDAKREAFINELVEPVSGGEDGRKLLVFSEYRATQDWVIMALVERFGPDSTVRLHGGMKLAERRESIRSFNDPDGAQFLVSTEAGGEGINLQKHCHVMANYDLPWNPMRIVQRIGRLYRYGQEKPVVVFNIHQSDTADEQVLDTMYTRLDQVAADLAAINDAEFNDALKDDILGELSDFIDIEDVLTRADAGSKAWSQERIDDALETAREAVTKQGELFRHAAGFDPAEMKGLLGIGTRHLQSFVEGMCRLLSIEITERTNRNLIWQLKLPDRIKTECGLGRGVWRLCFDRLLAAGREDVLHVDMDCWLLRYLVERAQRPDFKGQVAMSDSLDGEMMLAGISRWINTRGRRARAELLLLVADSDGVTINPDWVDSWLVEPRSCAEFSIPEPARARTLFEAAEKHAEYFVVARCSKNLLPDQPEWISACFEGKDH